MQKKKQIKKIKKKHVVEFENNSFLTELYGNHDQNLAKFENYFNISISYRGNKLEISGDQESSLMAADKIMELYNELDNGIKLGIKDVDVFLKSKKIDKDNFLIKTNNKKIYARSKNQEIFVNAININDLIFGIGPAGTGKTYTGIALAVKALKNKNVKRIILTRPAIEAGENLGFLPGDLKEKLDPYMQPLYDSLKDMIPSEKLKKYMEDEVIQIAPLAFMRGRTLDNAFVILDEGQNTTHSQMKMFLTRMGKNAKFIITGDPGQVDLPRNAISGIKEAILILKNTPGVGIVHLDESDVIRNKLVKKIVDAYKNIENNS